MIPYILNIHTATETAIINLSKGPETLRTFINTDTKQHAAFLHVAINEMLQQEGITMKVLNAIGITSGPGSYTGIRVGLAAAKGFCYALNIPLITYNSLHVMALSAADFVKDADALYCPMIDARRMEVYTAIYKFKMEEVEPPGAKVLTEKSYENYLKFKIIFSGSGTKKFKNLTNLPDSYFADTAISSETLTKISWEKYQHSTFENILYAEPLYIKEFHTASKLPF
ncbi:MAG: tRNA (adenosine(37)-N6)-threonylcarbamoyltransferase complex dimerization subunit type 1 TsaB [Ginsengibacter sp.]